MNGVPVGGTTGLDHESSAAVDEAAAWIASRPPHHLPSPIVPELWKLFGLRPAEACIALSEAALIAGRSQ